MEIIILFIGIVVVLALILAFMNRRSRRTGPGSAFERERHEERPLGQRHPRTAAVGVGRRSNRGPGRSCRHASGV